MATNKSAASTNSQPDRAAIEKRAQEIYLDRVSKNKPGTPEGDWLAAEKELSAKKK